MIGTIDRAIPGKPGAADRGVADARRDQARALGVTLAELVDDPEAFTRRLVAALVTLGDPATRTAVARVAPGASDAIGVPRPLLSALRAAFRQRTRRVHPDSLLFLADRLLREPGLEVRLFALRLIDRVLPTDPERGWQLLRRVARGAHEWITVDALAGSYARGILAEPYRWAEIEQLVYSPSTWERRLVASTIATLPFVDRTAGRHPSVADRAIPIVAELIGDDAPMVQKALGWALRSLARVDRAALGAFCESEAERARATTDGYRAWVVRDALPALDPTRAGRIRGQLTGLRRRPGSPPTSRAAQTAARFSDLPAADRLPEPPLS